MRRSAHLAGSITLVLGTQLLSAQAPEPSMPIGQHAYSVRGFFGDDEMEPWTSELSVSNTAFGAVTGTRATYKSRHSDGGWLYVYSASWSRNAATVYAEWVNAGREPSSCILNASAGTIAGTLGDGTVVNPVKASDPVVAEFAIGAYFGSRLLAAGDTVRFTMFRCLPHRGLLAIDSRPVVATVTDGSEGRAGARAEPVWIVKGDASYGFVAVIAKSDRMLLRSVTPQGTVGRSTDVYLRTH